MNTGDDKKTVEDLIAVMAALRTPGSGCPWDLEQTFATIAPYTLEEAYEVADAIARNNLPDLKEELGDLLLQVVYHARMAQEQGAFAFADVAHAITTKMIRRHPHVFGDDEARSAGMAKGFWERVKAEEKVQKSAERAHLGIPDPSPPPSLLDDIPAGMPGLTRALKLQDKAAKVGFDWPALSNVFDKLHEELTELQEAIAAKDLQAADTTAAINQAHIEEEFGDLLFVLANVGRHLKVDPEKALRGANQKFIRRFQHIESRLDEMGSSPQQSNLAEMDALWNEAKIRERQNKP